MVSPDKIVVYSTQNCGYCRAATHFLRNVKEVEVDVIDLSGDWEARKALIAETGHRTVPQIFIDDQAIKHLCQGLATNDTLKVLQVSAQASKC